MSVLVGKKAPSFKADAVVNGGDFVENFSLDQYLGKQHVVFFFYPLDFTFVCPTEIIAFQKKIHEFEKRNVAVVGCSVDSKYSHWAWLNTEPNAGGIKGVKFPLVSDLSKTMSQGDSMSKNTTPTIDTAHVPHKTESNTGCMFCPRNELRHCGGLCKVAHTMQRVQGAAANVARSWVPGGVRSIS